MRDIANPLPIEGDLDPNQLTGIDGYTHEPVKENKPKKGSVPAASEVRDAFEKSRLGVTEAEVEEAKVDETKVEETKVEETKVEEPKAPSAPASKK